MKNVDLFCRGVKENKGNAFMDKNHDGVVSSKELSFFLIDRAQVEALKSIYEGTSPLSSSELAKYSSLAGVRQIADSWNKLGGARGIRIDMLGDDEIEQVADAAAEIRSIAQLAIDNGDLLTSMRARISWVMEANINEARLSYAAKICELDFTR